MAFDFKRLKKIKSIKLIFERRSTDKLSILFLSFVLNLQPGTFDILQYLQCTFID